MTPETTLKIAVTYEDWNSLPRGGGKALCEAPSVSAVNAKMAAPLKWDGSNRTWNGNAEQVEALATALDVRSARILESYDPARGIAARLTIAQARRMARVAEHLRACAAGTVAAGEQAELAPYFERVRAAVQGRLDFLRPRMAADGLRVAAGETNPEFLADHDQDRLEADELAGFEPWLRTLPAQRVAALVGKNEGFPLLSYLKTFYRRENGLPEAR